MGSFVSRAGEKLEFALSKFEIAVDGKTVADFGSSIGGFVDCLLDHGVAKVYSVDTAYGELAWKLRNDPRVVVMERTNAMYVRLPEAVDVITVDCSWTKQEKVLPNALANLKNTGVIISLIKPHYEAPKSYLVKGKLKDEKVNEVVMSALAQAKGLGLVSQAVIESPIVGEKGGNREFLALFTPQPSD